MDKSALQSIVDQMREARMRTPYMANTMGGTVLLSDPVTDLEVEAFRKAMSKRGKLIRFKMPPLPPSAT